MSLRARFANAYSTNIYRKKENVPTLLHLVHIVDQQKLTQARVFESWQLDLPLWQWADNMFDKAK